MDKQKMTYAPVGNKHRAEGARWSGALMRELENRANKAKRHVNDEYDKLAAALIDKALDGDVAALKEFGDRIEGKVATTIQGNPDRPLELNWPLPKTPLDK